MNEKFRILHEAAGTDCSIQNFEFIVNSGSAYVCKQNTNLTVSKARFKRRTFHVPNAIETIDEIYQLVDYCLNYIRRDV